MTLTTLAMMSILDLIAGAPQFSLMMKALATTAALLAAFSAPVAAAETSPAAAQRVVERYYMAIDRGDFRAAYRLWDGKGTSSGKSFAAFRQGFAATARTRVVTRPAINGDAGMSQRWVDVPVDIHATLKNGQRQHFRGFYRLHRVVAGVGASRDQLDWHIASARLVAVR